MAVAKYALPRGTKLSLGFGLMTVPVQVKLLHETTRPVPGKRLCPVHGNTLATQTICSAGTEHEHVIGTGEAVTGYPHPDDKSRIVPVDSEWLKSLEEQKTGVAQIEAVVAPDTLDPVYLGQTFLVWAQPEGEALFDLLCELLRSESKAAVVSTVLRRQTQMIAFRWCEELDCLIGEVVRYSNEIRHADVALVRQAAAARGTTVDKTMLGLAKQLLESLGADAFAASEVEDQWTPVLNEAIRTADAGGALPIEAPAAASATGPGDLMAALQASVAVAAGKKPARKAAPKKQKAAM